MTKKTPPDSTISMKHKQMKEHRWLETLEALDSVKSGELIDGRKVDSWLKSWGTKKELEPPTLSAKFQDP
jgi:hypothetical protein